MSRTDIHQPLWVLWKDPTVRSWFADFHHHEDGICNLAEFLTTGEWTNPLGCYRQPWTAAPRLCGCGLCTAQYARHLDNRRARARWRTWRDEALKTAAPDRDTLDYIPPHTKAW